MSESGHLFFLVQNFSANLATKFKFHFFFLKLANFKREHTHLPSHLHGLFFSFFFFFLSPICFFQSVAHTFSLNRKHSKKICVSLLLVVSAPHSKCNVLFLIICFFFWLRCKNASRCAEGEETTFSFSCVQKIFQKGFLFFYCFVFYRWLSEDNPLTNRSESDNLSLLA